MPKPNWVADDEIWAKAVDKIEKQEETPQSQFSGPQHGMAAAEYKKMGGQSKKDKSESITSADDILRILDELNK
jgi:hypothetical protein